MTVENHYLFDRKSKLLERSEKIKKDHSLLMKPKRELSLFLRDELFKAELFKKKIVDEFLTVESIEKKVETILLRIKNTIKRISVQCEKNDVLIGEAKIELKKLKQEQTQEKAEVEQCKKALDLIQVAIAIEEAGGFLTNEVKYALSQLEVIKSLLKENPSLTLMPTEFDGSSVNCDAVLGGLRLSVFKKQEQALQTKIENDKPRLSKTGHTMFPPKVNAERTDSGREEKKEPTPEYK